MEKTAWQRIVPVQKLLLIFGSCPYRAGAVQALGRFAAALQADELLVIRASEEQ